MAPPSTNCGSSETLHSSPGEHEASLATQEVDSVVRCVVCNHPRSEFFTSVDGYAYYACAACDSIHADPALIEQIDNGTGPVGKYEDDYWEQERIAAVKRASGVSLCLAGEAILYCRRPVRRFLDIGAGPGLLISKLQELIDQDAEIIHGVEKFPPPYASGVPNLHIGDIHTLEGRFDAGTCIEVIEHLTPTMLDQIADGLARISNPGSFWLFNTGMPDYVRDEDLAYLDPSRRGHIISYSLKAVQQIFAAHGFRAGALPGKSFAFYAEYLPADEIDFSTRFYNPLPENLAFVRRNELLYHAAFETARSYYYQGEYLQRTKWAVSLNNLLQSMKRKRI